MCCVTAHSYSSRKVEEERGGRDYFSKRDRARGDETNTEQFH